MSNLSQKAKTGVELLGTMTGSFVLIGTLEFNPVIIIFDNFGTNPVEISTDGGLTTWKTFPGGEALVLDMRAASGMAANYSFPVGTNFYGNGTAAEEFSISYTYAE